MAQNTTDAHPQHTSAERSDHDQLLNYEAYELLLDQAQERGWPTGYFAQTYGALADDPISRPEQGDFEGGEPLE